jgi:putative transcriptional regulator
MRINRVTLAVEMTRRELTVNKLSELTGLTRSTISAIRGGKSIRPDTALKIADAFKMPIEQLLDEGSEQ